MGDFRPKILKILPLREELTGGSTTVLICFLYFHISTNISANKILSNMLLFFRQLLAKKSRNSNRMCETQLSKSTVVDPPWDSPYSQMPNVTSFPFFPSNFHLLRHPYSRIRPKGDFFNIYFFIIFSKKMLHFCLFQLFFAYYFDPLPCYYEPKFMNFGQKTIPTFY